MASKVKCTVGENDIGRALFATQNISQGEVILNVPQRTRPDRDMYSIEAYPGVHIECSDSVLGATNHSCKANAAVRDGRLVAWACIKAGEEITINYRMTETHLAAPFVCSCCNEKMEW